MYDKDLTLSTTHWEIRLGECTLHIGQKKKRRKKWGCMLICITELLGLSSMIYSTLIIPDSISILVFNLVAVKNDINTKYNSCTWYSVLLAKYLILI